MLTLSMIFLMLFTGLNPEATPQTDNLLIPGKQQPVKTIVINSNDQMKFDVTEIKVKAGEKIKLTLNHTGKMTVNQMGHNFVLLAEGTNIAKFAQAAMQAKANDYIPENGVLAHTGIIGGGESTTIEFTAPAKGTYDFICSFPGHYAIMKGKFIVQ